MRKNTLHIRVESSADFFQDALGDLREIESGEATDDEYVLSLSNEEALERVLNAKNLELIRTTARENPESVRDLARRVERDVKNVSEALSRLEEIGVVRLEQEGRAKRPVVWYDEIDVALPLGSGGDDVDEAIA